MEYDTGMTVPYLGSAAHYRARAEALWLGVSQGAPGSVRALTRGVIVTPRGMPMTLSLPVAGGRAALARALSDGTPVMLSPHGRWAHVHMGALAAAYGRTPYWIHCCDGLTAAYAPYADVSDGADGRMPWPRPMEPLTASLDGLTVAALDMECTVAALRTADGEARSLMAETARREAERVSASPAGWDECALGLALRRGRLAGLALLARVLGVVLLTVAGLCGTAADARADEPKVKVQAYTGYYRFVDEYGDTVRMTMIRDIYVYPPMKFKNKKDEEFYWRTVRDVRKTLPYAKLAFSTLCETYEYIQTIPDKKRREAHLKQLEKDIFEQYKPVMKTMTKNQGKVLLKLINRETDQSSYNIVKAFLGSFRAGFWQTFGRFFGMNMKAGFHPDKNREDAIIDRIATLIEQGAL